MTRHKEFRVQTKLMGSAFEFVILAEENAGDDLLLLSIAEVKRIEAILTEFKDTSETSQINKQAGVKPVKVSPEVYSIIKRSKEVARLTQGAFDITASVLKKLYNFKGEYFSLPSEKVVKDVLRKVGSDKIHLQPDYHVYLEEPGMHIGFGAIGKGYAADCVKRLLVNRGVTSGVINASGDLTAWGTRLDGSPWRVGIANPADPSMALLWIPVMNTSVATSGDYEQYFEHNSERYSHNIDPKTGKPVRGVKSVTVISLSAELSDALATALSVMGRSAGMHFIEQLPHVYAIVIDDQNKVHKSAHIKDVAI